MVATYFVMEWVIRPLKFLEITFYVYTEKHTKTYENPPNCHLLDLNYYKFHLITPVGSAFILFIASPSLI